MLLAHPFGTRVLPERTHVAGLHQLLLHARIELLLLWTQMGRWLENAEAVTGGTVKAKGGGDHDAAQGFEPRIGQGRGEKQLLVKDGEGVGQGWTTRTVCMSLL